MTEEEANCEPSAGAASERMKVFAEPLVAEAPIVAVGLPPVEVETATPPIVMLVVAFKAPPTWKSFACVRVVPDMVSVDVPFNPPVVPFQ